MKNKTKQQNQNNLEMKSKKNEILRNELLKIQNKEGLTAENVLENARPEDSPLHKYFLWDDTEAAEKYRLYQAYQLINFVIEPAEETDDKDKFYSFEVINHEYKHINEILTKNSWREQILQQAQGQLFYWQSKFAKYKLKPLRRVTKEIEKIKQKQEVKQNGKEKARRKQRAVATA